MLPVLACFAAHHLVRRTAAVQTTTEAPAAASSARVAPAVPPVAPVAPASGGRESNPYSGARGLTPGEIAVIKSTVPVLAAHGLTLTTRFYKRMLGRHPELKHVFNNAHQQTGTQAKALAGALYAYAVNIEDPSPLLSSVSRWTQKHASLSIMASQYPIVGENLLASLGELLTERGFAVEAVDSITSAWATAYGVLANLLIEAEEKLYAAAESQSGGWRGWRQFVVSRREAENEDGSIVSYYLKPKDGGLVPHHHAGQFTSVRMSVPARNGKASYYQPRQYTLSAPADGASFRISVKREDANSGRAPSGAVAPHPLPNGAVDTKSVTLCPFMNHPAGLVSNLAHELRVGASLDLSPPFGDHTLVAGDSPVVLIAAGVGITPSAAMMDAAIDTGREVSFLYGCPNGPAHPMRAWLKATQERAATGQLATRVWYSRPTPTDAHDRVRSYDATGRMDLSEVDASLLHLASEEDAHFYICGPTQFMRDVMTTLQKRGVKPSQIHAEMFGSGEIE